MVAARDMLWGVRWLIVLGLVGCLQESTVQCADGRICPPGYVCADAIAACVSPDDLVACAGLDDGDPCDDGVCLDGICLPVRCGDGLITGDEACDDGNTTDNDGCSSTCASTEVCGNGFVDLVRGEECDDGGASVSGDGCSSTCARELPTWHEVSPAPISPRASAATVRDAQRNEILLFGGYTAAGHLGDTWVWSGNGWVQKFPSVSPPPRYGHALAYDPVRKVVMMFGGVGVAGVIADTWEWDGTTWTDKTPAVSPDPRGYHAMAYDLARGVIVSHGGWRPGVNLAETWEWDGSTWTQRGNLVAPAMMGHAMTYDATRAQLVVQGTVGIQRQTWIFDGTTWIRRVVTQPTAVRFHNLVYDPDRAVVIAFGGIDGSGDHIDETWSWNGTAWTSLSPATKPPARGEATLAYHGGVLVLHGGFDAEAPSSRLPADTYTWNGTTWAKHTPPPVAPTPRGYTQLAYDRARGRALVYGGYFYAGFGYRDDLWQWHDRRWTSLGAGGPGPRSDHGLTYDLARERLVLFGGENAPGALVAGTWEWDGQAWSDRDPAVEPSPRNDPVLVYDEARNVTMLFGGRTQSGPLNDTWLWDGATWTQVSPAISPPARRHPAFAYDRGRQRVVMFGGSELVLDPFGDTWEWDGTTWHDVTPTMSPPPRMASSMAYDERLGRVVLFAGTSGESVLGDVWTWDGVMWARLTTQQTASPRFGHAMTYDTIARASLVFGGQTFTNEDLGETYLLAYEAPFEPVESCDFATEDADHDGLAGCSDPDCWGRCGPLCPPATSCSTGPRCGDATCGAVEDALLCPQDCP